jgi:MFS family permease
MNVGVFILHLVMTANFLVLPTIFEQELGLPSSEHWKVYLPVFLGSFLLSIPLIIMAEKQHKIRPLLLMATVLLIVAELAMAAGHANATWLFVAFLLFFIGFNFLEAVQPSLVAKYSAVNTKGTAMGIFSSSQFLGIFAGGSLGGMVNHEWGVTGVFVLSAAIAAVWLLVALKLPPPTFYTSRIVKLDPLLFSDKQRLHDALLAVPGVKEVAVAADECVAYLKVDKASLDQSALDAFSSPSA